MWGDNNENSTPEPQKNIISFDTQGGSDIPDQTINKGEKITRPNDPTKTNQQFNGWFTAQTGGEKVNLQTKISNEPTTIYAQWTPLIVTFDTQGGYGMSTFVVTITLRTLIKL